MPGTSVGLGAEGPLSAWMVRGRNKQCLAHCAACATLEGLCVTDAAATSKKRERERDLTGSIYSEKSTWRNFWTLVGVFLGFLFRVDSCKLFSKRNEF